MDSSCNFPDALGCARGDAADSMARVALTPAPAACEPPRLDGLHVLVVDDEFDSLEVAAATLQLFGASVTTAFSAIEALELVEQRPPDVIVCDLAMPVVSGLTFVRCLRRLEGASGHRIPAAAVTGFTGPMHGAEALASGYDVHVPKPIEPFTFATVVAMLAGRCS